MRLQDLFLTDSTSLTLLNGQYDAPLVALSLFVAILAGIMAFQLASMARDEQRVFHRQTYLLSGAFVLGSGVWSMHFIGMLAFSVCSTAPYDKLITIMSMLPSFIASWVALLLIAKQRVTSWQLVISGISVGAGIGVMHYSGMAAVHKTLSLRFDPYIFAVSIVVAVVLSILALWLRFKLDANKIMSARGIDVLSGGVVGIAISGMHYTGMKATHFVANPNSLLEQTENLDIAWSIAGITTLAILITGAGNALLRYRSIYQRMVRTEARTRTIVDTAVDGIITIDSRGIIRDFNAAAERIFGWQASEIIGKNIGVLMPEPQRTLHDSYIENYLRTGDAKIIGSGREMVGLRKDRMTFPMRLALGEATLQNETLFVGFITDITDSKRRNAEFEGVVNAISRSLAVIEFDLFGTILHANQHFLDITGYQLEELQGRHHSILCEPGISGSAEYQEFWDTLRHGVYTSGDFRRYGKHGNEIWIHGSYNPIFDPEGRPYKIIKFASDLSERHAMEQDLREAKVRAEQAAAAKNTFLANMSHEIRTPMNAILGFTDVLLTQTTNETQKRHLNTVRNSARSLLSLLNDILDTAKLERGAVELEITDFSVREVCVQVLATLRINAQKKSLPLVLDYPEDVPDFYRGDALRLQQILLNLVGNAIKFTEKGQVTLQLRTQQQGLLISVIDTGIGIAASRLEHIFDPFAQADASMSRRFGGTGLGTTIARQLIELMGGRIWVESELGVGSQFHVELPLEEGHAVQAELEPSIIALPPLHILAADDVPQNLELLQLLLQQHGHQLQLASNGAEAVACYREQRFDVVLMDVQMPVMNGLEASREIRRIEQTEGRQTTPIIALSASVLEADVKAARDAGMDGFAHKPIELLKLTQVIAQLLKLPQEHLATSERQAPSNQKHLQAAMQHDEVKLAAIDWNKGAQLWGDQDQHCRQLQRFLKEWQQALPQLINSTDQTERAATLHKLRGAAANLALSRLTELVINLEQEHMILPYEKANGTLFNSQISNQLNAEFEMLAQALHEVVKITSNNDTQSSELRPPATTENIVHLLKLCATLDQALAHGEFDEASLQSLAALLPNEEYAPLDQQINAFDFDKARQLLAQLQQHYAEQGNAA